MDHVSRRQFLRHMGATAATLAVPTALLAAQAKPKPKGDRPNFVIVLCDDLGYGDLGCYGSTTFKTPCLDRFATEGMRFTDCYAGAPLCSPSRAAMLTGRTPFRNGVYSWIPDGSPMHLPRGEVTIASLLKKAGYATSHVGKWHCNGKFNSPDQPQPSDHGFDYWFSTQNNALPSHHNPANFARNGKAVGKLEGYSSTLIVSEAIHWLRNEWDKQQPFLLMVWFHAPHEPIATEKRFMDLYADTPGAIYYGNVSQMDHEFGRLMTTLDTMKLRDNTFVFFTSDNGPSPKGNCRHPFGTAGPLRGKKLYIYEGGIREPGIMRWPGKAKPGTVCHEPINGTDFLPTLCDVVGIDVPADRPIDGVSFLPVLEGKPLTRKVPLYWRYDGAWSRPYTVAMRQGDWKILADTKLSQFALYNLKDDVGETTDLAAKEPARLAAMTATLKKLHAEIDAEGPKWPPWRRPRRRRKLKKGVDKTRDFHLAKACAVTRSKAAKTGGLGYDLECPAEGFALIKAKAPITTKAVFKLRYKTLSQGAPQNACLVFGQKPTNDHLVKCGTAIGMGAHAIFFGPWANLAGGKTLKAPFDKRKTFDLTVTVDLAARTVAMVVDGHPLTAPLPKDITQIAYFGIYAKATRTSFSKIVCE